MKITKQEFQAYEEVRANGVANMLDVDFVSRLSGLPRERIFEIIRRYSELNEKYNKGVQNK